MFSNQFTFPLISTADDRNEPLPTDDHKPELPTIYLQSGTFYDFAINTICMCTICTYRVVQALHTL